MESDNTEHKSAYCNHNCNEHKEHLKASRQIKWTLNPLCFFWKLGQKDQLCKEAACRDDECKPEYGIWNVDHPLLWNLLADEQTAHTEWAPQEQQCNNLQNITDLMAGTEVLGVLQAKYSKV